MADIFYIISKFSSNGNFTFNKEEYNMPCEKLTHYTLSQISVVPAVLIVISLGFTVKRKTLFEDLLRGRPGLIFPMDIMTRDHTLSYSTAFGASLFMVYDIVLDQKFPFIYNGPTALKPLVILISMLIYGIVCFPLFACLAVGSTYGYTIGSLYVWLFTGLTLYQTFQCAHVLNVGLLIVLRLPQIACLLYLCFSVPRRCYQNIRKGVRFFQTIQDQHKSETIEDIQKSYVGLHVKKLFMKPLPKLPAPEGLKNVIKAKIISIWQRVVYSTDKGFEYSSRFLSVMFLGLCLIYVLTVQLGSFALIFDTLIDNLESISENDKGRSRSIDYFQKLIRAAKVCYIVVLIFTVLLNILSILHMMTSYRKNLKKLHSGSNFLIPPRSERSNNDLLVGSIRYAGYQVAYIAWGYFIQFCLIFLFCFGIAVFIVSLQAWFNKWIISMIETISPALISAIILNLLQSQLAKFAFLQGRATFLAFENRRLLFCFTFFMFFYNIFLGLLSCLLRIIKVMVLGAFLLPRLDNSTLPQRFQFCDPGFAAYVGFLHIENSHNHPVVLVFARILLASRQNKKTGKRFGDNREPGNQNRKVARFNWHLLYTLINNPEIRRHRKGYLQAVRKEKVEEKCVPITDKYMTHEPEENNQDRSFTNPLYEI